MAISPECLEVMEGRARAASDDAGQLLAWLFDTSRFLPVSLEAMVSFFFGLTNFAAGPRDRQLALLSCSSPRIWPSG